jgi:hypothetical protein
MVPSSIVTQCFYITGQLSLVMGVRVMVGAGWPATGLNAIAATSVAVAAGS